MKKNRDLDIGSWPDIVRKMYLTMKICVCMLILGLSAVMNSVMWEKSAYSWKTGI